MTRTAIEGSYKNTGANYQGFTSFQTSAKQESWHVKVEQPLLKNRLRITGFLKQNDFDNPYLLVPYNSNTVFKSINISVRVPRLPILSFGYQPMSQLTVVDQLIFENRFQSLTANVFHSYRIKTLKTTTNVILNKFYNDSRDTGFLYYNAINLVFYQNFFFSKFTSHANVNIMKNPGYLLSVLEVGVEPMVTERLSFSLGTRINTINEERSKVGGYLNLHLTIFNGDQLTLGYEHGYLPGNKQSLVRNEMGSIQFFKSLKIH